MTLKVGLILYSVRDEMAKDPIGTVEKVGELGYRFIETCNHNAMNDPGIGFGVPAADIKAAFDKFGSKVISTHIYPLPQADLPAVVEYNHIVGNTRLVNPMGTFTTYDDLMKQCEEFNRIGKFLHEEGIQYLYHNHQMEYRTFNGKTILDHIVENTDPEYVGLELDTFWTMRGGQNPVDMLKKYGNRIKLVHQKDFAWDSMEAINLNGSTPEDLEVKPGDILGLGPESSYVQKCGSHEPITEEYAAEFQRRRRSSFTEIGTGIMDIQAIIDTASACTAAEYIILEQDYTSMPSQFDSIIRSMEGFRKFTGIEWE